MENHTTLRFKGSIWRTFEETNISKVKLTHEIMNKANVPVQCLIYSGNEKILIIGEFNRFDNGCWHIGVCPASPEIPIPSWPVRFSSNDDSTILEIDVPEDFSIEFFINGNYEKTYTHLKKDQEDFYKPERINKILKNAINAYEEEIWEQYDDNKITEEEVIDLVLKNFEITREEYRKITRG